MGALLDHLKKIRSDGRQPADPVAEAVAAEPAAAEPEPETGTEQLPADIPGMTAQQPCVVLGVAIVCRCSLPMIVPMQPENTMFGCGCGRQYQVAGLAMNHKTPEEKPQTPRLILPSEPRIVPFPGRLPTR